MRNRDIVAIGASAGGIELLVQLMKVLPKDLPASLFVVQHLAPYHKSQLASILNRESFLKVVFPKNGEAVKKGHVYLAPPDHHLLVENGHMLVAKGPKENRFRPSIDALFRSVAYNYGQRVIGVVLSGSLDDGTSGLWSVKRLGGITVVQDPHESSFNSMPSNAIHQVEIDHVVSINEMGSLLERLVNEQVPEKAEEPNSELNLMATEVKIAAQVNVFDMGLRIIGKPSPFVCPECHGSLSELQEGPIKRYRCHTGHAYSATSLLSEVSKKVEEDLWSTVRGLEETVMLLEQTGKQCEEGGNRTAAHLFYQKAEEVRERSGHIRELIFQQEQLSEEVVAQQNGS
jgi:two-component system, chemotaxis family, protein-glutamate methylesterase/glutaminase